MDLKEFMSVRRAYNAVRQSVPSEGRLTFRGALPSSRLDFTGAPMKTSDIAEYQGALRPTMTHRTNHLAGLGLIDRSEGENDRRNVVCSISEEGRQYAEELADMTRAKIGAGRALSRTSADRIKKYVDAMGAYFCKAGDLVLLGIYAADEDGLTIMPTRRSHLQPTVSMSVSALVESGMVERERRGAGVSATTVSHREGRGARPRACCSITKLVVRRKARGINALNWAKGAFAALFMSVYLYHCIIAPKMLYCTC